MLTLLDSTLCQVHRRYLPKNVGTHLQLSIMKQMGTKLQNRTMPGVCIELATLDSSRKRKELILKITV